MRVVCLSPYNKYLPDLPLSLDVFSKNALDDEVTVDPIDCVDLDSRNLVFG